MSERIKWALVIAMLALARPAAADSGEPVAVRWWGQGYVTIETFWNLRVAIDPYTLGIGYDDPGVEADLVLVTHEHQDHNNVEIVRGRPRIIRGLDDDGDVAETDIYLDRRPNEMLPQVFDADEGREPSPNAVRIRIIAAEHDDVIGQKRGHNAMMLVEVDGVRILHCGDLGESKLSPEQLDAIGSVHVLLIPVGGFYTIDGQQAAAIVEKLQPSIVVPIHFQTEPLTLALTDESAFLETLSERFDRRVEFGNTLAVRRPDAGATPRPAVVLLKHRPNLLPEELAALLDAKEAAAGASQAVFGPLSVTQMNHKPSDGTHTPRWNVEHMAGRELGFFSQIYHAADPMVPVMDRNPRQMPPDYAAAQPDWTGAEEARQIERVQAFTRRFSYLLHAADLDQKPRGHTWWTLRGLLEQMQRHYGEHTANVRKKFDLPDWPAQ